MSGNRLGATLSRLVRRRAYLGGEMLVLQKRVEELRSQLATAESALQSAQAECRGLDDEIAERSVIQIVEIRPICATPRTVAAAHGAFIRELIRVIRDANGAVDMADLVPHMMATFAIPYATQEEREKGGYLVRRCLNRLREKGAIERLPSVSPTGTGVWRWCADHGAANSNSALRLLPRQ